jgi:hypothetical protein
MPADSRTHLVKVSGEQVLERLWIKGKAEA